MILPGLDLFYPKFKVTACKYTFMYIPQIFKINFAISANQQNVKPYI